MCRSVFVCVRLFIYVIFGILFIFWKKLLRDKVDFKINFFFNVVVIIELNENEEN